MVLGCPTDTEKSTASNEMINLMINLYAQFLSEKIFHLGPTLMTKCAVES